jgi:hypothetical protein
MSGFSYAVVEAALAKVFGADAMAQKRAFRGRLQHLRRLGLPSGGPGRGKAIAYAKANIYELGFCLECEELGIIPTLAVNLLAMRGDYILEAYERAERDFPKEWFFWFSGLNFMSASWSKEKPKFPGLPVMQAGSMRTLEHAIARLDSRKGGRLALFPITPRRLALFQMTPLVREVLQAVKAQE